MKYPLFSLLLLSLPLVAPGQPGGSLRDMQPLVGSVAVALDEERGEPVLLRRDHTGAPRIERPFADLRHVADAVCAVPAEKGAFVFLGDGEGLWQHYRLTPAPDAGGPWGRRLIRELHTGPDSEHCVVSPDGAWLFVAEEDLGIWAMGARPEASRERILLRIPEPFEPERLVHQGGALRWIEGNGAAHPVDLGALPADRRSWPRVRPRAESATVPRFGDAADDPAIYSRGGTHLVIGTDKRGGLLLLDADGALVQRLETGRLNNVDVLPGGPGAALVVATDRTAGALATFRLTVDPPRLVPLQGDTRLDLGDPYGLCAYLDQEQVPHAFANDTDGRVVHVRVRVNEVGAGDRVHLEPVAAWRMASQTEGCVVDAPRGILWLGEEARGVWRFPITARRAADGALAIDVDAAPLVPDVEGIARVRDRSGRELLLVSSQGDDSFALFDVSGSSARWMGSFRIGADYGAGIDGASETDGLELHPGDLGGRYPGGVLVVQDGRNRMPDAPQNFKFVAWGDVLAALDAAGEGGPAQADADP